jgi:hypothetical protein
MYGFFVCNLQYLKLVALLLSAGKIVSSESLRNHLSALLSALVKLSLGLEEFLMILSFRSNFFCHFYRKSSCCFSTPIMISLIGIAVGAAAIKAHRECWLHRLQIYVSVNSIL